MITITLEGGLVQGVYSDDQWLIGQPVVVNDYDSEAQEDDDELVDLFDDGARSRLHVEFVQRLGSETAAKLQEWRDAQ